MNDTDTLRRAAALMRERAEKATPGSWRAMVLGSEGYAVVAPPPADAPGRRPRTRVALHGYEEWETDKANAAHVASWHPAVALAVADMLDDVASIHRPEGNPGKEPWGCAECYPHDGSWPCATHLSALDVARTYLGEADR